MLGHVGTSRLIGSGPIRPPVRPSKGQSDVLQAIDHSVTGSMTAQPPGIHPSALRVATHGQQVASLGGSYPSAEVQSVYSTAPADRAKYGNRGDLSPICRKRLYIQTKEGENSSNHIERYGSHLINSPKIKITTRGMESCAKKNNHQRKRQEEIRNSFM